MWINDKYEFRQNGQEFEPTKQQLITFISDVLQKRDDEIDLLKQHLSAECEEHREFCDTARKEMHIRNKALELACEMVYQFDNSQGLWCFDMPLDEYYNTLDEEEIIKTLVGYFIIKAEQEEQQEQEEQIEQEE